jgi:hypothetical protein
MKKKILFLCTHNAARSQMAEGFVSATYADQYEAHSAGNEPTEVHPCAIEGMATKPSTKNTPLTSPNMIRLYGHGSPFRAEWFTPNSHNPIKAFPAPHIHVMHVGLVVLLINSADPIVTV